MQFHNIRCDILKVSKGSRIVWQLARKISQIKSAILLLKVLMQLNAIRCDIVFSGGGETEQALHTLTHRNVCEDILFFFFIIILALHRQQSVYCDSGFHTFFFWPRLLLVLKFLQDGSTYFSWSEKVFVQLPQTTIMSRHIAFNGLISSRSHNLRCFVPSINQFCLLVGD